MIAFLLFIIVLILLLGPGRFLLWCARLVEFVFVAGIFLGAFVYLYR